MQIDLSLLTHRTQRGATLIEVLVSMFILALGVMALLAMQVRTSAGIKEAEVMSVVAQATQNLTENMSANPTLVLDATKTPPETSKRYADYTGACPANAASESASISGDIAKKTLATAQKNRFCATLQGIRGIQGNIIISVSAASNNAASGAAPSDAVTVNWVMGTNGTASGVQYSYTQPLEN